jgi:thymidylate synthase
MIGLSPEEALNKIGLYVQYSCSADPSDWDPIFGKSSIHIAGEVHSKALERGLK